MPSSPLSITAIVRRESSGPPPHTKLPRVTAVVSAGAVTGHKKELQGGAKWANFGGKLPGFESHLVALEISGNVFNHSIPQFSYLKYGMTVILALWVVGNTGWRDLSEGLGTVFDAL